jgi:hypothetical protein
MPRWPKPSACTTDTAIAATHAFRLEAMLVNQHSVLQSQRVTKADLSQSRNLPGMWRR